jgi:hypothetical protein
VLKGNNDGTQSLSEVRFGGKKYELQIGEQTADEAAGSTK